MRLGAVHAPGGANGLYRIVLPMMALEERGHQVVRVEQGFRTPLVIDELADCDLVHIHRPVLLDDDGALVTRIHEAGALIGFDDDDNIAAAPPGLEELTGQDWMPRAKRNFDDMIARVPVVDLLTTPNPELADQFEAAGGHNVHIIENYLPGKFLRVEPRGHDGLVVGWHAADEHLIDVEALGVAATLERLLEAHPHVHVVTINIDLGIEHERYHREEVVRFDLLTERLADFDVGIVPLADIPFNQGRSNVKAREYAAAAVPWLASPVGAYRPLGKSEGGRLVQDDGWFAALDKLVRSPVDRALLRRRARAWAKRETIWRMAPAWERAFLETIEDARAAA
jgi:glycosyltransferase involved in cell wall biosynthesis